MILPKQRIFTIVKNLISEEQLQPAGVDVTLREVRTFESAGRIDFDNSTRKISDTRIMESGDEIRLRPGSYKVVFNEYVKIPEDVAAFCFPRSSLLRCGADLRCALWDPGYEGRSEALLVVYNPHGIALKKNAKIGQLVFIRLTEKTKEAYKGIYKGENPI